MLGSLSTLGYAMKGVAQQVEDVLIANTQALLVDTRLKPWCSWSVHWQRSTLETHYGKRYIWKGATLGNINYASADRPIQLANETQGIDWLLITLEQGYTIILLCGCAHYATCHRRVIYERVQTRLKDRLPCFALGQRVMTPNGPGMIDPAIPLDVQVQRNRYAVLLDVWHPTRYYFPDQLEPYSPEQLILLAS